MTGTGVHVVIPHFQKERGILARAVRSILAQRPALPDTVVIVDDGSPVPAEADLADLPACHRTLIEVVRTTNGGPGRARNVGLDALPSDARFVAFLDSDDEWFEDHLETAMRALALGDDFYFCDFFQVGQDVSLFRRYAPFRIEDHPAVDPARHLHAFAGDIVGALVRSNFIRASAAVLRWPLGVPVRFSEDLRWSDEDTLFWLELCSTTDRIVFCAEPHVRQGRGVNVNAVAAVGDSKLSRILIDEVRFYKLALQRYAKTEELKAFLHRTIAEKRANFIRNTLALALRGNVRENARLVGQLRAVDEGLFAHVAPFVLGAALRRLRRAPAGRGTSSA